MENKTVAMYFALICVCCVGLVSGFYGLRMTVFNGVEYWSGDWLLPKQRTQSHESECEYIHMRKKPCSSLIARFHHNGTFEGYAPPSPNCLCGKKELCPIKKRRKYRLILYLLSEKYFQKLQMMFCGRERPTRRCNVNETAIVLRGINAASHVHFFNCVCDTRQNLVMTRRWAVYKNYERIIYEDYGCGNHMRDCKDDCIGSGLCFLDKCMDKSNYYYIFKKERNPKYPQDLHMFDTHYFCKCPDPLRCKSHPKSDAMKDGYLVGYCQF